MDAVLGKTSYGEHDSRKARHGVNEKQTLAVLDHTERSSMEIHGIALQIIFKSRYHGKEKKKGGGGGGAKILATEIGFNNWVGFGLSREIEEIVKPKERAESRSKRGLV